MSKKDPDGKSQNVRVRARRMTPEARRAQLVQAALAVFATKGIEGCGHTDLAEEAGVAVPTTFHYFPTKDDLVAAVLDEVERFLLEEILARFVRDKTNAAASIEEVLLVFFDCIDSHPDYIRVWLEWSVAIRGSIWSRYLTFYAGAVKGLKKILRRGLRDGSIDAELDIEDGARVVMGVCHMVVHMKFANNKREAVQHTIHSLVTGYFSPRD